ncbi:hypothetical protein BD311DRAFT_451567 [Dichomitus squalens]|uniref:Uncharacterized protein n=1 Tax=Dichomitus squalens TaxID=114155 RepID=A0A4V2JZU2_9APHY|nr:hypothetical protein BD311DRAFT_451567 [Dichomitus squalens]
MHVANDATVPESSTCRILTCHIVHVPGRSNAVLEFVEMQETEWKRQTPCLLRVIRRGRTWAHASTCRDQRFCDLHVFNLVGMTTVRPLYRTRMVNATGGLLLRRWAMMKPISCPGSDVIAASTPEVRPKPLAVRYRSPAATQSEKLSNSDTAARRCRSPPHVATGRHDWNV